MSNRDFEWVSDEEDEPEMFPEETETLSDTEGEEDIDYNLLEVETHDLKSLEFDTVNVLQEMEQTRERLLHYGEQYDVLPHMRCYQCGKVIGDLWEPYLDYSREKYYKPENIIELLPLNDYEKDHLISIIDKPDFEFFLVEYGVKSDYYILKNQRKYTNEQIFNKLGGKLLLTEDESEKLYDALTEPEKFRTLLREYNIEGEYDEIVRIRLVNELYDKPLLSENETKELEKNVSKPLTFRKLLKKYHVKDAFQVTFSVENSILLSILFNKLDYRQQLEDEKIKQEEYEKLVDNLQDEIFKRSKDDLSILNKYKIKKEFNNNLNQYVLDEIKKLRILNQIQQRNLLTLKGKPEKFQSVLEKYKRSEIFNRVKAERGYEANPKILERLGGKLLRPCCRMNLLSPIHVPIQQEAFKEVSKTVQISNVLMNSQTTRVSVSINEDPDEGPSLLEKSGEAIPFIPGVEEPLLELGSCEMGSKKKSIITMTELKILDLDYLDLDLDTLPEDGIEDIGEASSGIEEQIHVGAGRTVTRKSRKYRAR